MILPTGIIGCRCRARRWPPHPPRSTPRARRPRWPPWRRSRRSASCCRRFTTSRPGPSSPPSQLAFACASLALYRPVRRRQTVAIATSSLPVGEARPGGARRAALQSRGVWTSLGLFVVALVAVVGLAKIESPPIEDAVESAPRRTPRSASSSPCLFLAPDTLAALRNARHDRVQTSFNLALGSAMAASSSRSRPSRRLDLVGRPTVLGLGATQMVLLRHHGRRHRPHRFLCRVAPTLQEGGAVHHPSAARVVPVSRVIPPVLCLCTHRPNRAPAGCCPPCRRPSACDAMPPRSRRRRADSDEVAHAWRSRSSRRSADLR